MSTDKIIDNTDSAMKDGFSESIRLNHTGVLYSLFYFFFYFISRSPARVKWQLLDSRKDLILALCFRFSLLFIVKNKSSTQINQLTKNTNYFQYNDAYTERLVQFILLFSVALCVYYTWKITLIFKLNITQGATWRFMEHFLWLL